MKKIVKILGVLTGILSMILGMVVWGMSTGSYESSVTYGGDAYTGIQNASAQTANNITCLADIMRMGFGSLLFVAGIVTIFAFILVKADKEQKNQPVQPQPYYPPNNPVPINNAVPVNNTVSAGNTAPVNNPAQETTSASANNTQ